MRSRSDKPSTRWREAQVLPVAGWPVQHWQEAERQERQEGVTLEEPFEIRLNGRSLATVMRTPDTNPDSDRELALGFLLTEGILSEPSQVQAIVRPHDEDNLPAENVLDVRAEGVDSLDEDGESRFERRFIVASSCGICGKNSIEDVCRRLPALEPRLGWQITPQVLYTLPDALRAAQAVFEQTGGLHAMGLFDQTGQLLMAREDIGRHNALDKIVGRLALDKNYPAPDTALMVSGRTSFEIVQKALAARIGLVAAVSAPSSLALELAQESGMTLVGFLRHHSMNVYTHPWRVSPA